MPADNGPYETETQARIAAHRVISPEDGWSILRKPQNQQLLRGACETAGVELGEFDRRILDWLAGFEDSACAVIAGIIRRAGQRPEGTVTGWGVRVTSVNGYHVDYPADDEASAREQAASHPQAEVVRHEVTPWVPVAGEEKGND